MKLWEALQAVHEGKKVEYKLHSNLWWDFDKNCGFSLCDLESASFRLKPEPPKKLVMWVNEYNTSEGAAYFFYLSKDLAEREATGQGYVQTIRMREWPEGEE